MNNDEKKISATEGNENAKAPVQNKSAAAKQNSVSFGDWWKNLCVIILLITVLILGLEFSNV